MKKSLSSIGRFAFAALAALAVTAASCSSDNSTEAKADTSNAAAKEDTKTPLINIRYIDGDSVSANYNLAKDFQEQSLRTLSRMQQVEQSKTNEIQNFGKQIEQKMRNNGYLTEESYNADMLKLNKMQQDAATQLSNMQRNAEQELAQQQSELNDSIEAFIKEYNAKKGYDAILFKGAGVYFNPALDITDEVIEGLNARYNKVAPEK